MNFCPKIFEPGSFSDFLAFAARWNHFSALNILLLFMQCPKAEYICDFKTWQSIAFEQGLDINQTIIPEPQRKNGIALLIPFSVEECVK